MTLLLQARPISPGGHGMQSTSGKGQTSMSGRLARSKVSSRATIKLPCPESCLNKGGSTWHRTSGKPFGGGTCIPGQCIAPQRATAAERIRTSMSCSPPGEMISIGTVARSNGLVGQQMQGSTPSVVASAKMNGGEPKRPCRACAMRQPSSSMPPSSVQASMPPCRQIGSSGRGMDARARTITSSERMKRSPVPKRDKRLYGARVYSPWSTASTSSPGRRRRSARAYETSAVRRFLIT